jgi:cation diffusion facilitator CzcD-associated flavoprotein CzcO
MSKLDENVISASAVAEIEAKYNAERDKRLQERPQGEAQFIDLTTSEKFKHLQDDPWVGLDEHTSVPVTIDISKPIKYLIVGAGYSGLLFAVRLLEAGAKLEELVIVDSAGGYGGVWYWNRYPGLMCDVESYIYMPLLEETGYMPKHKYSYGPELRGQANRIADKWNLRGRTLFRQQTKKMNWDAGKTEWIVKTQFAGDKRDLDLELHVKYVLLAGGQATRPKIPVVEGFETFKGHIFHTSRWNYEYTGGTDGEVKPELTKLKDKKVGIIGTGATAVQAIPELAKYAKQLFVVQRTPSSIDVRNQRETDPEEWKNITDKKGWWWDRNVNFAEFLHQKQPQPAVNMVSDRWVVENPSYCTAWGNDSTVTLDQVPEYVEKLHVNDIPRAERVRKRVDEIVKDKETAQNLKHWYPTYKVLGGSSNMSPAFRFGITITGKDGLNMDAAFQEEISTLHGLCRAGFPNLFFAGASQASLTANQIMSMDTFAKHIGYVIMEGQRKAGTAGAIIESTQAAQDAWSDQVAAAALGLAGMGGCTPNYLNLEGELDKLASLGPEVQAKMMRGQIWGRGINNYVEVLEKWRSDGVLRGLDIKAAA